MPSIIFYMKPCKIFVFYNIFYNLESYDIMQQQKDIFNLDRLDSTHHLAIYCNFF